MHEVVQDLTGLLKAIAWPTIALAALIMLRGQIRAFLAKLRETLGEAAHISIGTKGLEIKYDKKIAAMNSRISALNAVQNQVTETVYKTKRRQRRGQKQDTVRILRELRDLADAYVAVNEPDWQNRVLRKNELALRMGDLVIREDISRDQLAREQDEVLHLALAAAVAADPEAGDLDRILLVARTAKRLHVRYKLVVALISLINKGLVQDKQVPSVRDALRRMSAEADERLNRIIGETESLLDAILLGELAIAS